MREETGEERRAVLARDIVADHTGPWKKIEALARKFPEASLVIVALLGFVAGRLIRR